MMEAIRLASEITTTVLDAMSVDELREFGELYGINQAQPSTTSAR
jgi:hypothetical protein